MCLHYRESPCIHGQGVINKLEQSERMQQEADSLIYLSLRESGQIDLSYSGL